MLRAKEGGVVGGKGGDLCHFDPLSRAVQIWVGLELAARSKIPQQNPRLRNGQSTVGGPKWTKMDHFGPFWSREC